MLFWSLFSVVLVASGAKSRDMNGIVDDLMGIVMKRLNESGGEFDFRNLKNLTVLPKKDILKNAGGNLTLVDLPDDVHVQIKCTQGRIGGITTSKREGDVSRVTSDEYPTAKYLFEVTLNLDQMYIRYSVCEILFDQKQSIKAEVTFFPHVRIKVLLQLKGAQGNCSLDVPKAWYLVHSDPKKIRRYTFAVKYGKERTDNPAVRYLIDSTITNNMRFYGPLFLKWVHPGHQALNRVLASSNASKICEAVDPSAFTEEKKGILRRLIKPIQSIESMEVE